MLKELGYKPEFERLSEKFIHEKSSTGSWHAIDSL
jgi:hypothetical protein